jgi:adenosylcobinamide-GDP ribazoletransferase
MHVIKSLLRVMRSILLAIQFLTILPVRLKGEISEGEIARCSAFFPVAGALQGVILMVAAMFLSVIFPADVVSGFIIAISVILNGGFHLDGLADTFDAIAVKSSGDPGKDREKRLSVMKDSTTGAIGVVAIVTVILLEFVLIRSILSFPFTLTAFFVIGFMPVFSRWIMVPAMYHGTSARKDGLGRLFIGGGPGNMLISSALLIILFVVAVMPHVLKYYGWHGILISGLFPAGYLFALAAVGFFDWRFRGLTGDMLGALSETGEILYLAGSCIWLRHFI